MTSKKHEVPEQLLASLLADYKKPEDLIGENGLLKQLTKLLVEKALDAELTEHLGHERHETVGNPGGNTRNGKSRKTLKGEFGELPIEVPRDRNGTFEPQLIPKHQTRWAGFDDKIISLYARGMTVREIQSHLQEMYGTEVSPSLISSVTDAVSDEVKAWQARPLDPVYPIVYLDCIHVKVREGAVRVKAVYLAIGITMNGEKEVLGLWLAQTEGAKFWLKVFNELKNRGLDDILIAVVDGLRGFPEAIEAVYPQAQIQTCIVHLIRNSTTLAAWKDRKELAAALKPVYQAANADLAAAALEEFAAGPWGKKFPTVAAMWRRQWQQVIPFFAYPPEVRTIIYTTNAIESLHMRLRKIVKNRGHFPSDEAASKLLFLALRNIEKDWKMPQRTWKLAANQFAIMFGERFTNAIH